MSSAGSSDHGQRHRGNRAVRRRRRAAGGLAGLFCLLACSSGALDVMPGAGAASGGRVAESRTAVHARKDSAMILARMDAYAALAMRVGVRVERQDLLLTTAREDAERLERTDDLIISTRLTACEVLIQGVEERRSKPHHTGGGWEATVTVTCSAASLQRARLDRMRKDRELIATMTRSVQDAQAMLAAGDTCAAVQASRAALASRQQVCFWNDVAGNALPWEQQAQDIDRRHGAFCDQLQNTLIIIAGPDRGTQILQRWLHEQCGLRVRRVPRREPFLPGIRVLRIDHLDWWLSEPAGDAYLAEWTASLEGSYFGSAAGSPESITVGPVSMDGETRVLARLAQEVSRRLCPESGFWSEP